MFLPRGSSMAVAPLALALNLALAACQGAPGAWEVRAWGERYAEEGIEADAFADGWAVTFDRLEVALADLALEPDSLERKGAPVRLPPGPAALDVARPSEGGGHLAGRVEAETGSYPSMRFRLGHDGAACSVRAEGAARRGEETVRFDWCFVERTAYLCEPEGGFEVESDGELVSEVTVHADHLFYDDLLSATPDLRFDLIASADVDGDGEASEAELASVELADLDRYQVGSFDVDDLWGFLSHQATTLGHLNGEGHCAFVPAD